MNVDLAHMADELGPQETVFLHEPGTGLQAIVVIDNIGCGPAIGGVRMAPDVCAEEVFRLARAMTFKNAAAGLPHGGGKAGIIADPGMPPPQKEALIRACARLIEHLTSYIPGPDMGTDEECMAWIKDEIGRVVGLPRILGGIPLDEIGATGLGVAVAAEVAADFISMPLDGARVAIQGFGAVGRHAARFLAERGCVLVAASDSRGAIHRREGLNVGDLIAHKAGGRPLQEFTEGAPLPREELLAVDCDIWIPAARPDVLTIESVEQLRARLVLQGANIPATGEAELWMHENGVLNIPDFIANAGGVICASVEYHGGNEARALVTIDEKIRTNTAELLMRMDRDGLLPRVAATQMARARIEEAMAYHRV
jgi:glutamate dehydrogenase/leucine dehydrogenase